MTGVFLQARLESTRLPRKILLPLAGKPLLQHAMEALRQIPADVYAVLTDAGSAAELDPVCRQVGFQVFRGDPHDVLKRYADAARHFQVDRIVRATGDNPLVSSECAMASLELFTRSQADYAGILNPPYGTAVEVVRTEALFESERCSDTPAEREHVTAHILNNRQRFRVVLEDAAEQWRSSARVTIDTPADYAGIQRLFEDLYRGSPIPLAEVVEWCRNNPAHTMKVS